MDGGSLVILSDGDKDISLVNNEPMATQSNELDDAQERSIRIGGAGNVGPDDLIERPVDEGININRKIYYRFLILLDFAELEDGSFKWTPTD